MKLIAGRDADNRCYIGQKGRDEEWLLGNVSKVMLKFGGRSRFLIAKDIVTVYLRDDPGVLVFLYAERDVELFFQSEVTNKHLLDDYMQKDASLIRIQRKRTKGWKMPENTISVCRPSIWGNPFKIEDEIEDCKRQLAKFDLRNSDLIYNTAKELSVKKFESAYLDLYSIEMTEEQRDHMRLIRDRIRDLVWKESGMFLRRITLSC